MKTIIAVLFFNFISSNSFASNQFCEPMASKAAKAIADINGSVSNQIKKAQSKDGKMFTVKLQEKDIGEDTYHVSTNGGHDCVVLSVKIKGQPTQRP